ncbi:MAG: glycerophosphodiester phosphodiesterase family protein [Salinibacter sp.]
MPPVGLRARLLFLVIIFRVVPDISPVQDSPGEPILPNGIDLQGHRGARGLAPENTIPAFRRALEIGVTTLEMDVVVSGDGQVVVSHEPWMNHKICSLPSGAPVPADEEKEHTLYRMPYAEIERYDCGRRQHPDFPRQETFPAVKPLLRDVIAMAESYVAEHDRPPVFYNIEIKSRPDWDDEFHPSPDDFARRVLRAVREGGVANRTIIQSFDERVLRVARREGALPVRLALLVMHGTADTLSVSEALVQAAHDRGLRVVPWTVNERDAVRRLVRLGVDGLITDYPDVAQDVLEAMDESSN